MKANKRQSRPDTQEQKAGSKRAKVQAEQHDSPEPAVVKPAGKAKQSKSALISTAEPAARSVVVGSGRQAAQGVEYKEKAALALPDSKVTVKQEQVADTELAALDKTKSDAAGPRRQGSNQYMVLVVLNGVCGQQYNEQNVRMQAD